MEASEAREPFYRMAKITSEGPDVIEEIGKIVKELGYLTFAITLAGSYVSVTPRLQSDIRGYFQAYRRRRRKELFRREPKQHVH